MRTAPHGMPGTPRMRCAPAAFGGCSCCSSRCCCVPGPSFARPNPSGWWMSWASLRGRRRLRRATAPPCGRRSGWRSSTRIWFSRTARPACGSAWSASRRWTTPSPVRSPTMWPVCARLGMECSTRLFSFATRRRPTWSSSSRPPAICPRSARPDLPQPTLSVSFAMRT